MKKAPDTDLTIINATYEFVVWSCQHLAKFPRNHRYVLGARIESRIYDVLENLIQAKYSSDKVELLQQANVWLELLRFQFRLAKDLKCLSLESYGHSAKLINDIGVQLGGWMKQAQRRVATPT